MNTVAYFEIQANNPEELVAFYQNVFGWKFVKASMPIEYYRIENGGKVALAKFAVPGKCWQGYFLDTDGNVFGIFEVDDQAK